MVEDPEYPWLDIHPDGGIDNALEQLAGAAVQYRSAVGPIAGRKTMTLHNPGAVSCVSDFAFASVQSEPGSLCSANSVSKAAVTAGVDLSSMKIFPVSRPVGSEDANLRGSSHGED